MSVHPEDFMSAHAGIQNEIEYSKVSMHKNFDALIQEIQNLTESVENLREEIHHQHCYNKGITSTAWSRTQRKYRNEKEEEVSYR